MPPRNWRTRVADILDAVARISRYTGGLSEEDFVRDDKTIEALCFALVVIGEAAAHVPESVQASAPDVPWRKMKGMRNIATHEYFGLDVLTLWQTAVRDIPTLVVPLRELLSRPAG